VPKKTYKDFETKKTIHFNITREAHSNLRIICFKKRVSMQEVFEEISQRIAAESPDMMDLINDLSQRKRDGIIKKLSKSDVESLFNVIEKENPLAE
jgi:translation initiation factor 2 alpha subunit (eIF-2alpha)